MSERINVDEQQRDTEPEVDPFEVAADLGSVVPLVKAHLVGRDRVAASNVSPGGDDVDAIFLGTGAIAPPYDPDTLCALLENSNSLRQNIDAYVTNIDAFGHRFEPGGTRRSVGRQLGLRIGADMARTDSRIAQFVRESQSNFVRDEYGRRRESFGGRARDVVAAGIERGLGRDDIAAELSETMTGAAFKRSRVYWEVVAMVFTNRARTFTQVHAFQDARIAEYRFDAILDEVTGEACRFLHGRVFSVGRAVQTFAEVERAREPERIRELQPFVQVGINRADRSVLFYERGGRRRAIAQIDEPGVGRRDAVGRYSREVSTAQLEEAGITLPPLHGRCRSTVTALVGEE